MLGDELTMFYAKEMADWLYLLWGWNVLGMRNRRATLFTVGTLGGSWRKLMGGGPGASLLSSWQKKKENTVLVEQKEKKTGDGKKPLMDESVVGVGGWAIRSLIFLARSVKAFTNRWIREAIKGLFSIEKVLANWTNYVAHQLFSGRLERITLNWFHWRNRKR